MMSKWSKPFAEYYTETIHPNINHIGGWLLAPFGIESPTTNQSEAFNHVLKKLQDWKEAPVDAIGLTLFRLAEFYLVEITRGRCGLGNYLLRDGLTTEPLESIYTGGWCNYFTKY
jgi:hypothetical protein